MFALLRRKLSASVPDCVNFWASPLCVAPSRIYIEFADATGYMWGFDCGSRHGCATSAVTICSAPPRSVLWAAAARVPRLTLIVFNWRSLVGAACASRGSVGANREGCHARLMSGSGRSRPALALWLLSGQSRLQPRHLSAPVWVDLRAAAATCPVTTT